MRQIENNQQLEKTELHINKELNNCKLADKSPWRFLSEIKVVFPKGEVKRQKWNRAWTSAALTLVGLLALYAGIAGHVGVWRKSRVLPIAHYFGSSALATDFSQVACLMAGALLLFAGFSVIRSLAFAERIFYISVAFLAALEVWAFGFPWLSIDILIVKFATRP